MIVEGAEWTSAFPAAMMLSSKMSEPMTMGNVSAVPMNYTLTTSGSPSTSYSASSVLASNLQG